MAEWGEAWEEIDYTPEEIMGTGDTALVTLLYDGVGKGSGMRIEGRFWYLIKLRDGKVYFLRLYRDHAEALEAAGLLE